MISGLIGAMSTMYADHVDRETVFKRNFEQQGTRSPTVIYD